MYIATFVPFEIAKNIIRPSPDGCDGTFAMRSLRSCQLLEDLENDTVLGDHQEAHDTFTRNGGTCHSMTTVPIMVSCWTMIHQNYVTQEVWTRLYQRGRRDKFARTDGIALVSTVDKVSRFFENYRDRLFSGQAKQFRHGKVKYPRRQRKRPQGYDDCSDQAFVKRYRYHYQREYRFMFLLRQDCPLDKITFYVDDPCAYINKVQFGPDMTCKQRKDLLDRTFEPFVRLLDHPGFDKLQQATRCPLISIPGNGKWGNSGDSIPISGLN